MCTPSHRKVPPNHGAVLQKPGETKKLVDKEVKLGLVLGPFKQPPVNSLIYSPLNLIPKAGNPGKYHLIHNLAFPYDSNSINGNIPDSQAVVTYAPFDQAVCICLALGPGCRILKMDYDSTFRIFLISG